MIDILIESFSAEERSHLLGDLVRFRRGGSHPLTAGLLDTLIAQLANTEEEEETAVANDQERKARRGYWVELKTIKGHGPYAYKRWYEGRKKRSEYVGKVVQTG